MRANAGDFAAASDLCRRALVCEPLNAALHFYQGLVLRALGRPAEAEKSFLKSLYLDKNFAMAHYHLGLLLIAEGGQAAGRRSLTHAAQSVAALADDCPLDEGDGVTARELRDLVRIHLDIATPSRRKA
jgi:chemotaxis protein methyltransferase CheR